MTAPSSALSQASASLALVAVFSTVLFSARLSAAPSTFDEVPAGAPPPGWISTQTGTGQPHWTVVREVTAPSAPHVLQQSGIATFPLCLRSGPPIKDGFVVVKFRSVSGREDQAGGLVWRWLDADNYYVARANALENNVTIYRTVKGRRIAFKTVDVKVTPAVWHSLRVDFIGDKFTVTFDGHPSLVATDATFASAGLTGVWTKADSVTLFDDFDSAPLAETPK